MVMGKCKNWQRKFCIAKGNYKHFEARSRRLSLGNVYTCGFFSRTCKFEKANSITTFHKFIVGFVDRGFGFIWQPPINKIYETK
jgi:hypothetical protein